MTSITTWGVFAQPKKHVTTIVLTKHGCEQSKELIYYGPLLYTYIYVLVFGFPSILYHYYGVFAAHLVKGFDLNCAMRIVQEIVQEKFF